ncbi:uncharacterized protein BDZ99DRAFT_514004 [Mytilinidion resinicola]|uniref:Uncharacterized protein n=1 Tax=Mytilinidion resinicola TaxID=574789 RepID=A0A6A6ZC36_9PEZI|nr:uncharacterized protein BDZ99DRAFT_514004 [Mytilinidion resinicola]KAF2817787.1 hypothetical protein BDZ99DRAFT_514004 [Mytilinidion resinicola]
MRRTRRKLIQNQERISPTVQQIQASRGQVEVIVNDATRLGYAKPLLLSEDDEDLVYDFGSCKLAPNIKSNSPSDIETNITIDGIIKYLAPPSLTIAWCYGYLATDDNKPFSFEGVGYKATYTPGNTCASTAHWGFSYIFLSMISTHNYVWSTILAGTWIDAARKSRMYKAGRRLGLLRSVMDLSYAIREELGTKVQDFSEEELKTHLRESDGAMVVSSHELRVARDCTVDFRNEQKHGRREWARIRAGSSF